MDKFEAGSAYRHVPVETEIRLVNKEDRIYDFVASTNSEDRHGTRLFGWKLDNYARNSVILWSHNGEIPPIGRALRTWVDGDVLRIRIQFPPEGVHELADTVRRLVEEDYLRSGSVGFIPGRVVYPWEREQDEDSTDDSIHLLENELVEYSLTPVPSNPDALQLAMSRGIIGKEVEDCFVINKQVDGSSFDDAREALTRWLETELPEETVDKKQEEVVETEEELEERTISEELSEDLSTYLVERDALMTQLNELQGLVDGHKDADVGLQAELKTITSEVEELVAENTDLKSTIRSLNGRITDLEEGATSANVSRRLADLEHRAKAEKVISVEGVEEGLEIPSDLFDKIDQIHRS
jgi:hypothetical protein